MRKSTNERKTEYYIQIHINLLCNIYIYCHRYYDYDHHHHHHYYYYYSHDLNFSMFHLSYKFASLA